MIRHRTHDSTELPSHGLSRQQIEEYGILRTNKAHTATANRIARRLQTVVNTGSGFDIQADGITIEVETTASMLSGEERLSSVPGRVYIAMTNKDGVKSALAATDGSRVGIMDPYGNIVRESQGLPTTS